MKDLRNASRVGDLRFTREVRSPPPDVAAAAERLIAEFAAATD